jgi:hypothetical protein
MPDELDAPIQSPQSLENLPGGVCGAIIDADDFERDTGLLQYRPHALV